MNFTIKAEKTATGGDLVIMTDMNNRETPKRNTAYARKAWLPALEA
jgi:hypothetical protein